MFWSSFSVEMVAAMGAFSLSTGSSAGGRVHSTVGAAADAGVATSSSPNTAAPVAARRRRPLMP